jgi:hypothetical protein
MWIFTTKERIWKIMLECVTTLIITFVFEHRWLWRFVFFWDITAYSPLKVNGRFGRTCHLHLQIRTISQARMVSCLVYSSTLKMKANCSSETSVDFQRTTWPYFRCVLWLPLNILPHSFPLYTPQYQDVMQCGIARAEKESCIVCLSTEIPLSVAYAWSLNSRDLNKENVWSRSSYQWLEQLFLLQFVVVLDFQSNLI